MNEHADHIKKPGLIWMELKDPMLLQRFMDIKKPRRVSRRELAKAAGWKSHSYMNRLLNGEVSTLEVEPAVRIAAYLGVPVDILFTTRLSTDDVHHTERGKRSA